ENAFARMSVYRRFIYANLFSDLYSARDLHRDAAYSTNSFSQAGGKRLATGLSSGSPRDHKKCCIAPRFAPRFKYRLPSSTPIPASIPTTQRFMIVPKPIKEIARTNSSGSQNMMGIGSSRL